MKNAFTPGWRRRISIIAIVLAAYSVAGFFLVPYAVKRSLESRLNSAVNGKISIQAVKVNPFVLSFRILGFESFDEAGRPALSFDEFYANIQLRSFIEKAPTFSEIKLERPKIHLGRRANGEFNLANIIKQDPQPKPTEEKSKVPHLIFDQISVSAGNLIYFDEQKNKQFTFELLPLKLELLDFRTEAGHDAKITLRTENQKLNELGIQAAFSLFPLKVDGTLTSAIREPGPAFNYLAEKINVLPPKGEIHLLTHFQFDSSSKISNLLVDTDRFELKNVHLKQRTDGKPLLDLVDLSAKIRFNLAEQHLEIADLQVAGGAAFVRADDQRKLNVSALIETDELPTSRPEQDAPTTSSPWKILIERAGIKNFKLSFEDVANTVELNDISLQVPKFSSEGSKPIVAHLEATCTETGKITADLKGDLAPLQLDSHLLLTKIQLSKFSSYLSSIVRADIVAGEADASTSITISDDINVMGDLAIAGFSLQEANQHEEVIAWKQLNLKNFQWKADPQSLKIEQALFMEPKLALKVASSGNFVFLERASVHAPPDAHAAPSGAEATEREQAFAYQIKALKIDNGQVALRDESVQPAYRGKLSKLSATLRNLSADRKVAMPFTIEGRYEGEGEIEYDGSLLPSSAFVLQNGTLSVKNLDLISFSPYSIKYLGKSIRGGKLYAELKSKTTGDEIFGENNIILDRFRLGNREHGEPVLDLPVGTALSILRDSSDKITLDLPVRGNIHSAGLSYRKLLFQSFQNIIIAAVTSPLSIIASLYNFDSNQLSRIEFEPKSVELSDAEQKKLDVIKKAVAEKEELRIEIRGAAAIGLDAAEETQGWNEELQDLAKQRASAIRQYLMADGLISGDRVYIMAPKLISKPEEKTVSCRLSVKS